MSSESPDSYDIVWPPVDLEQKLTALAVACAPYALPGQLETEVRRRYGIGAARFWQGVNRMITEKEVLAAQPVQCYRLARLRDARKNARANLVARSESLGA